MSTVKAVLRRLRTVRAINRPATSALRALTHGRPPDAAVTHLARTGIVTIHPPGGTGVRFVSGDDWITSRMWWLGMSGFEPEALGPFLRLARDARVILDVGAYVGHYSLFSAAVNPGARVFAFEPVPWIAARLGHNISLNPELRVTSAPYAVGSTVGPARFHLGAPGMPSSSSLVSAWEGLHESIDVATIDLDTFAREWGVTESVDLVKMDVEMGEPDVIDGMKGLLSGSRPTILTEVLPGAGAEKAYGRMTETLLAADYRFFHLTKEGAIPEERLTLPAAYIDHLTTPVNHLACPIDRVPDWL